MSTPAPDAIAFARLVDALRPWLPTVVFAGGWAHRLYRQHPLAQPPKFPPLMTKDTDVALGEDAVAATAGIRDRLIEAGFVEDFSGDDRPPVTYYRFGDRSSTTFAEFMVPLSGGWNRRDGTPDVTVKVGGVNAQKLRFLELLLTAPWRIDLDPREFPIAAPTTVQLPNPASYLAQKILIHGYRNPAQRAKDMLYVHDTVDTFADALPELRRTWVDEVKPTLHANHARRVERAASALQGEISDEAREAALLARAAGRALDAERITQVCAYGLGEVFAKSA